MDNPLGNTAKTFFGNISSVPKVFLMGTSWLHYQDHLKCTENSLPFVTNVLRLESERACGSRGREASPAGSY